MKPHQLPTSAGNAPVMRPRSLRWLAALAVGVPLFGASACRTVEFHEMEAFTDPVMALGDDSSELHLHQKVYYSMEGSAGGIGSSAGGGCGCF